MCYDFIMIKCKHWQWKLIGSAAFVLLLLVAVAWQIPCVWKTVFGIPCPGCGMTGAWRELLCGHVGAAFSEHAMFWSVPLLYLYILADGRLFKNTLLNYGVLIAIGVGFLVVWGVHLFC